VPTWQSQSLPPRPVGEGVAQRRRPLPRPAGGGGPLGGGEAGPGAV